MRVKVIGEVRYPGFYKFPPYKSDLFLESQSDDKFSGFQSQKKITTISDVIRKAGGITSLTDLSRIEIIRDIPLGKGGGKKEPLLTSILI